MSVHAVSITFAAALALMPALPAHAQVGTDTYERARWAAQAQRTMITRDDWGIAHVKGATDADAVFAMIYAQAEDDFNRIETNYLTALGRLAEAEGERALWQDLRQRLYIDPMELRRRYIESPAWLQRLMVAWADGLNYYLATHPQVKPRVIRHFDPWMALSFSEGSIGGDIERIPLDRLEAFYGTRAPAVAAGNGAYQEPKGSNGIAIAPRLTQGGKALLLINPHTSFFFRAEQQVTSDEGLNAYGAATWGQFFIYQGFNAHLGWMHTSSGVDSVDEFAETIVEKGGDRFYRHGTALRPVTKRAITLRYRTRDGKLAERRFTTFATHHGPVTGALDGKWIATALMNTPVAALQQSFLRTKAVTLADYLKESSRRANSSNNTLIASDNGDIAYLHPQFVPKRSDKFDYRKPVEGSNPAADWQGLHALNELPQIISPAPGWVMNTNNWPWRAAGSASPSAGAFPRYMDEVGENPRGLHALELLEGSKDWTIESLRAAAYDPHLTAFDPMIPPLVSAWERLAPDDPLKDRLAAPVALLKGWDRRWSASSAATSLAVHWGEALWLATVPPRGSVVTGLDRYRLMTDAPAAVQLAALAKAIDRLTADFGGWQVPWGEINRFQRISPAITARFSDGQDSVPVPFTSAQWGSLASFGTRTPPGEKRRYGTLGNSFVAIVEFGPRVRAIAVSAGGESGDPKSRHFNDQAERYAAGDLRPVYFYTEDLNDHIERRYHPGK